MKSKPYPLKNHVQHCSPIVYGCMGLGGSWSNQPVTSEDIKHGHMAIDCALDNNISVFDHADIYTLGKAEKVFGQLLKQRPELRDQITLQSKCGIRFEDENGPKRFDFSSQWITQSVEGILSRLHVEQLDILMLHRPDPLMEVKVIADTFEKLQSSGKVKHFGVSNMHAHQMNYLQSAMKSPLVVNQVELSLKHLSFLEDSVTSGCSGYEANNYSSGMLEYAQMNNVQIQAWGSLCQGLFCQSDYSNQPVNIKTTGELVTKLAQEYQTSKEAIVLAWLMRHPANIQPIIGTTNIDRINACAKASSIEMSREHWYAMYVSARGDELP